MKTMDIPISKIHIIENHRVNIDKTNLDELMQSIKQHGVLQPVGVAVDGKRFSLRFGQRRYLACKKLGFKTIPAMVSGKINDQKLLLENLTENMQRKDPSFAELGRIIQKLGKELSLPEIAVRLGIPLVKVRQILQVYTSLPEKYQKKIIFMEKGGGRKANKGMIPASVATRIVGLKREHSLNDKQTDQLFQTCINSDIDKLDLDNVGSLLRAGMDAKAALANAQFYGVYTIDIVVKRQDVTDAMSKHGLLSRQHLFKKILYGELPALMKPSFINSGPIGVRDGEQPAKKVNVKPYEKIRAKLVKLEKAGKLTEEQELALKTTAKIPAKKWTLEQMEQLKAIFEDVTQKKKDTNVEEKAGVTQSEE